MKSTINIFYSLLIMAVLLSACSPVATNETAALIKSSKLRDENPTVSNEQIDLLAQDNNGFAFDIYHILKEDSGNLFYSPYSISLALAMTYAGAEGNTADQMRQVMHYNLSNETLHAAFNALSLDLQKEPDENSEEKTPFQLNLANSIWGQKDFAFQEDFLDLLAENYDAGLRVTDFAANPDSARQTINKWVSDQTKERIQDLIPQGAIDAATRLVLANAIYFKAAWLHQFEESATQAELFYRLDGSTMDVQMMNQQESYDYLVGDGYKAIDMPYSQGRISMTIILPEDGKYVEIEDQLSVEFLNQIVNGFDYGEVNLSMPKFTYESMFTLNDALATLGMSDAFDPGLADFSGMDGGA